MAFSLSALPSRTAAARLLAPFPTSAITCIVLIRPHNTVPRAATPLRTALSSTLDTYRRRTSYRVPGVPDRAGRDSPIPGWKSAGNESERKLVIFFLISCQRAFQIICLILLHSFCVSFFLAPLCAINNLINISKDIFVRPGLCSGKKLNPKKGENFRSLYVDVFSFSMQLCVALLRKTSSVEPCFYGPEGPICLRRVEAAASSFLGPVAAIPRPRTIEREDALRTASVRPECARVAFDTLDYRSRL